VQSLQSGGGDRNYESGVCVSEREKCGGFDGWEAKAVLG